MVDELREKGLDVLDTLKDEGFQVLVGVLGLAFILASFFLGWIVNSQNEYTERMEMVADDPIKMCVMNLYADDEDCALLIEQRGE